jgi:cytochrome c oxidase assembly factor CtaG
LQGGEANVKHLAPEDLPFFKGIQIRTLDEYLHAMVKNPRRLGLLAGAVLVLVFTVGPMAAFERHFFWAHMISHLVLMMIAVPLFLLGRPIDSLVERRPAVGAILEGRFLKVICNPVLVWILFVGTVMGVHFSPFLNYSLTHPLIHYLVENPLYVVVAFLYYWSILPGNHSPARLSPAVRVASLFAMMVPETMTGFFIYITHTVNYPFYLTVSGATPASALTDQQLGGGLMWAGAMIIDSVWIAVAVQSWYRSEERKSILVDAEIAAEREGE